MLTFHPVLIPVLLSICFWAGIACAFATGAPGYAGALLAVLPLAACFFALYKSLGRSSG